MKEYFIFVCMLVSLLLAVPVSAQRVPDIPADHPPSFTANAPETGIHVSGHWTFSIYDTDGKYARSHSFENALTSAGAQILASVLNGDWTTGLWSIELFSACKTDSDVNATCVLTEPEDPRTGSQYFNNLSHTVEHDSNFTNYYILLRGTFEAGRSADIVQVGTARGACQQNDIAPATCTSETILGDYFTEKLLDTPITLEAGQTVVVEVRLNFE